MDKKQLEEEIQNITRQLIEKYNPQKKLAADFLVYRPQEFQELVDSEEPFTKSILDEGRILYS